MSDSTAEQPSESRERPWISDEGHALMHELARALVVKVPDENFDMRAWIADKATNPFGLLTHQYDIQNLASFECNTVGCAMGHAAWLFRDRIEFRGNGAWLVDGVDVGDGYEAACALFGITGGSAARLFHSERPSNRHLIASSLIRFADTGELPEPGR